VNARPKSVPKTRSKSIPRAKRGTDHNHISSKKDGDGSFPIVAIGASAGGLEAYTEFFHALSSDTGMAIVLVQHLDPTHHSLLTEIIAKTTRISVEEVKSGTRVRPNRVYVIPPNYLMALAAGRLKLTPRSQGVNKVRRQSADTLTINFFMRSLA
jgi:two-component system CheB/CheR fusion protein